MQFSHAVVLAFIASAVAQQTGTIDGDVAAIPACAKKCLDDATIGAGGCSSITDFKCQCGASHDKIQAAAGPCVAKACSASDLSTTLTLTTEICKLVEAGGTGSGGSSSSSGAGGSSSSTGGGSSTTGGAGGGGSSETGAPTTSGSGSSETSSPTTSGGSSETSGTSEPTTTGGGGGGGEETSTGGGGGGGAGETSTSNSGAMPTGAWNYAAVAAGAGVVAAGFM